MAEDEETLIAGLRRRDGEACRRFVEHHGPVMLAVARRFLGNGPEAEDCV